MVFSLHPVLFALYYSILLIYWDWNWYFWYKLNCAKFSKKLTSHIPESSLYVKSLLITLSCVPCQKSWHCRHTTWMLKVHYLFRLQQDLAQTLIWIILNIVDSYATKYRYDMSMYWKVCLCVCVCVGFGYSKYVNF